MRNLNERLNDIKYMLTEATNNVNRSLEIIKESLENNTFNPILYGEAKSIENLIDDFETNVDEEVTKTIARFQPMGINLRFLISVIKISMTLERMNDLSMNILKVIKHSKNTEMYKNYHLTQMLEKVRHMFDLFLKSYEEKNLNYSYLILSLDDEVNAFKTSVIETLKKGNLGGIQLEALFISQHLERIGDCIKNLAEIIVYIHNGIDIRHHNEN